MPSGTCILSDSEIEVDKIPPVNGTEKTRGQNLVRAMIYEYMRYRKIIDFPSKNRYYYKFFSNDSSFTGKNCYLLARFMRPDI